MLFCEPSTTKQKAERRLCLGRRRASAVSVLKEGKPRELLPSAIGERHGSFLSLSFLFSPFSSSSSSPLSPCGRWSVGVVARSVHIAVACFWPRSFSSASAFSPILFWLQFKHYNCFFLRFFLCFCFYKWILMLEACGNNGDTYFITQCIIISETKYNICIIACL